MYYIKFKVTGRGLFPLDMLRHDECHPRTGSDAANMHWDPADGARTVELACYAGNSFTYPTIGRWSSFGWSVDPESIVSEKVS